MYVQVQAEAKRNEESASNLKSELDVALNEKHEMVTTCMCTQHAMYVRGGCACIIMCHSHHA